MANDFLNVNVGDVVICFDEYSHDYDEHRVKVDNIENDSECVTETNPNGRVLFGTDLDDDNTETMICTVYESNFVRKEEQPKCTSLLFVCDDKNVSGDIVFSVNIYRGDDNSNLGTFNVSRDDVRTFYDNPDFDFNKSNTVDIFNDMSDVENYFENVHLSKLVEKE